MVKTKKARLTYATLSAKGKEVYHQVRDWLRARCISPERPTTMFLDQMKPVITSSKDGQYVNNLSIYQPFGSVFRIEIDSARKTIDVKARSPRSASNPYATMLSDGEEHWDERGHTMPKDLFALAYVPRLEAVEKICEAVPQHAVPEAKQIKHLAISYVMGKSPKTMARIASNYFFTKVLDPRVTSILYRVLGFKWSLTDYAPVWQHLEACEEAMRIAPGAVLPWIILYRRNEFGKAVSKGPIPDMLYWFNKHGLKSAQWKWLIRANPRLFICAQDIDPGTIRALSDPGVKLPFSTVCKMFTHHQWSRWNALEGDVGMNDRDLTWFIPLLRAMSKTSPKRGVKRWGTMKMAQLGLIRDAFLGEGGVVYDHNRMRNASWATWMRVQEEWHRLQRENADEIYREKREKTRQLTWDSKVLCFTHGKYTAVALNTGLMLEEEGHVMHHCVEGYINLCASGGSRIFSIRDGEGERISTLEIRRNGLPSGWSVQQNRGVCNECVESDVEAFGHRVAQAYSEASAD